MSGLKSILVHVGDANRATLPLDVALRLGGEFGSHVTGFHVRVDPASAVPVMGEGMSGAIVEELMEETGKQAAARAKACHEAFDAACARNGVPVVTVPPAEGVSAEWVDVIGREEELVARRAHLADLVVFGRPGDQADMPSPMTVNAALMESGRPLLLVPFEPTSMPGRNIAIAWNGSAEAGRAVSAAMPLLQKAASVTVLSVNEENSRAGSPAHELIAYLAWHGVQARSNTLPSRGGSHAGETLVAECRNIGSDLLVMGAYTHSRLRQLILGGVTRHIMTHVPLPCLLSH